MSHPMWVRGLKPLLPTKEKTLNSVAPYVGAWIETCMLQARLSTAMSHPMWVRGLKHTLDEVHAQIVVSHPMWVRGLKRIPHNRLHM